MPDTPRANPSASPAAPAIVDRDDLRGLTTARAREALARTGPNEIQDTERHGLLDTLRSVATEPMFLLLVVAAGLYLLLG